MTIKYSTALRNRKMNQITATIDEGGKGRLKIYSGTRPAFGGSAGSLLADLAMATTSFGAASNGVITANAIASDQSANAAGTATWFRITDGSGAAVIEGDVGKTGSGKDLEMASVSFSVGLTVSVSSLRITEGN